MILIHNGPCNIRALAETLCYSSILMGAFISRDADVVVHQWVDFQRRNHCVDGYQASTRLDTSVSRLVIIFSS